MNYMNCAAMGAALLTFTGTMVNAETKIYESCVDTYKYSTAFYSENDFLLIKNITKDGASSKAIGRLIVAMIDEGRAIKTYGMNLSPVVIDDDVALAVLPNGKEVWTFPISLRCK